MAQSGTGDGGSGGDPEMDLLDRAGTWATHIWMYVHSTYGFAPPVHSARHSARTPHRLDPDVCASSGGVCVSVSMGMASCPT